MMPAYGKGHYGKGLYGYGEGRLPPRELVQGPPKIPGAYSVMTFNPPDAFGGWSAVDETVRLMMRPEVPGVTA
jgi:hypothetical protein